MTSQTQTATAVKLSLPSIIPQDQGNLPVPMQSASLVSSDSTPGLQHAKDVPAPEWMPDETRTAVQAAVQQFVDVIKSNPVDAQIVNNIGDIGKQGEEAMTPAMTLYNVKVGDALGNLFTEDGGTVNRSLLDVKRELDRVNPSVLKNQKVAFKWFGWLFPIIGRLPKGDEILQKIYKERTTVGELVSGIKRGLLAERDKIQTFMGEIQVIYGRILVADRQDESDEYFGQLLLKEVDAFRAGLTDSKAVANMEEFQASLQRRVNFLRERRVLNNQFFDGAMAFMRNARMQLEALEMYAALEQSILANLGLKAASRALVRSAQLTKQLGQAVSDTLADTAAEQRQVGEQLLETQKSTMLDLEKVEKACQDYDALFEKIKRHNRDIIVEGAKTGERLRGILVKQSERTEIGHTMMQEEKQ